MHIKVVVLRKGVSVNMRGATLLNMRTSSITELRSFPFLCRKVSNNPHQHGSQNGTQTLPETKDQLIENEPTEEEQRRPRRKPSESSVLLFPGQGSQFVGMGRGLLKYRNVKDMFAVAQKILGYDLLSMCLDGPEEELMKTVHCQPAVFVTSLAAVERLNHENPAAIENCVAAAGFSVGEFAALVFSGAMDFTEALYAVKVRAEAMQKASELIPSGMLSVMGRPQAKYKYACLQAREHCLSLGIKEPVCSVANYLFPDGRVIAGHKEALDFLQQNSRKLHFLRARPLPVRRPEINVYSNVDAKRYMHEGHVRRQLAKQLVSPVKWEQTLHEVFERTQGQSFPHTYEVGPGKQLGATLQKCNMKAYKSYTHVDVTTHDD
ncbi:malonyl-CoA-acyl carrier protein transacylase, mitochondrial isoform X2 [Oncorhynchus keta]|uniref:malonyl-CoA-acyl carrier protein transacylase, mitochondrial isoform X2 n=1 Tax=Oncorhynchus keta TaxID=8018 RepID=UPI00227B16C1|nr:malonyl-CoA-acyl carrier protein transacylase, mitochondrial isoform X2 [Oncorhynchus keta]